MPINKLKDLAKEYYVFDLAKHVLDNPKFELWSGSSNPNKHHYGKGQLAQHTLEVVQLCLLNNKYFSTKINEQHLFLAALYHDVGKMWDYEPCTNDFSHWKDTEHKNKVYHITRSALEWNNIHQSNLYFDPNDDILHAILAHHRAREWGSPVEPTNHIAWMLHLCDSMSARMYDCLTFKK